MFKCRMWLGGLAALALASGAAAQSDDDALVRAISAADTGAVIDALAAGADPDAALAYGERPLLRAIELQDLGMVTALLQARANPDLADVNGLTALALACERGDETIVLALLDAGADVNFTAPDGVAPLALCARFSTGTSVRRLLDAGARVDTVDTRGQSALMWAASSGNLVAMRALIEAGAQVNRVSKAAFTPLFFAITSNDAQATNMLLDAGANLEHRGPENTTALQLALYQENIAAAQMLLARGRFDLAKHDRNGELPLHVAAKLGAIPLLERLVELGADPNGTTGAARITWVTEANFGVPPPPVPPTPPLLLAAKSGQPDAMQKLIELGADPAFIAKDGTNIVLAAAEGESAKALAYALTLAPDANFTDPQGQAALHRIVWREFADLEAMLSVLAARGANPKLANARGVTPEQMVAGGLSSVRQIYERVFSQTS